MAEAGAGKRFGDDHADKACFDDADVQARQGVLEGGPPG